ncbi:MAG: hypothetical protein EOM52_09220 [Clostridia bacterium]|nr:hypothetical protein [Clostridia bacterium]
MRTMKQKAVSLFLALSLVLGLTAPAFAAAEPLPRVGDTLHGFTVTGRSTLDLNGAPTLTLEHVKSGATLYYVASDDRNRTFGVSFRTPALDDRGMSHILEHCSLSGGEKYPSPNLFFAAANQTYNTFVNAMTGETTTAYPVSSLSEDQLFKLMDLYLDGVFHPMLYTDKRIFDREAWRYDLSCPDAPITLTGTVYNEMKGAVGLTRAAMNNGVKALFPGTILGSNSGGAPEAIPSLSWEDLVSYHKTYYQPSNALFFLNGQLDLNRVLAFLDERCLSGYSKTEVSVDLGAAEPLTGTAFQRYEYPAEKGSPSSKAALISYGMAAEGASRDEAVALTLLSDVFSEDTSSVSRAVAAALPGARVYAYAGLDFAQPYVMFTAEGVDETDAQTFRTAVDQGLREAVQSGLSKGSASAAAAAAQLSFRSLTESSQFGPDLFSLLARRWNTEGTLDYFNYYGGALERMKSKGDSGYFESVAQKYLIGNPRSALSVTVPVPGLKEERDAAQAKTLADFKSSLSPSELAAMVKTTAEFNVWSSQEPTAEEVASLKAISVKDLPEDLRAYKITDKTQGGVRSLTAEAQADGLGAAMVSMDLSGLKNEDLLWASLYSNLVGKLDTDVHTAAELASLIPQVMGSFSAYPSATPGKAAYTPALSVQWMGGTDGMEEALSLAGELLFRTDLTDASALKNLTVQLRSGQKNALNGDPGSVQAARTKALIAPEKYAVYNYMTGLDFYAFLGDVETRLTVNPGEVIARLSAVQSAIHNRRNAVTMFAGDKAALAGWKTAAAAFWKTVPRSRTTPADRSGIPLPAKHEAVAAEAAVQYNMIAAPLSDLGLKDSGKLLVLGSILNDRYLTPQTRHIIGAYGSSVSVNEDGLALSTYRDPALGKTYEVFAAAPRAMENMSLTQDELDGYIMSCYSSLARPRGMLTGAMTAMTNRLMGRDSGYTLGQMRAIKTVTLGDVKSLSPALQKLNETGFRASVGGAAVLEANAGLFDAILYPNGRSDDSLTRADALAFFPGTVLLGDGSGARNESTPITRQELAVLLYRAAAFPIAGEAPPVTDLTQVSPWAREAVLWAVSAGVLGVDEDGYFHPRRQVTKASVTAA